MIKMLNERQKSILYYVIREYLQTGKPVSSMALVKNYHISVSSATVRNDMNSLEKEAFLFKPHTSAGRIPTEKAFRYYAKSMIEIEEQVKENISDMCTKYVYERRELKSIVDTTGRILSMLTDCLTAIETPNPEKLGFRYLDMYPIGDNYYMAVILTNIGIIETRPIKLSTFVTTQEIDKITTLINEKLRGMSLESIREKIKESQIHNQYQGYALITDAFQILHDLMKEGFKSKFIVKGITSFAKNPFVDAVMLKKIARLTDNERWLVNIFSKFESTLETVNVLVGSDINDENLGSEFSIFGSAYGYKGSSLGKIVLVAPIEIEYGKITSLLRYTSERLTEMFSLFAQ